MAVYVDVAPSYDVSSRKKKKKKKKKKKDKMRFLVPAGSVCKRRFHCMLTDFLDEKLPVEHDDEG